MKKNARILSLVLSLVLLCAACSGCGKKAGQKDAQAGSASAESTAVPRLESGYATPEEAFTAYVEAMNRGDAYGMYSTFAVESFVSRSDPRLYLEYTRRYTSYAAMYLLPRDDDFFRSLAAQVRYGYQADGFLRSCSYGVSNDSHTDLSAEADREALVDKFRKSPLYNAVGKVEFVRWISPVNLSGGLIMNPRAGNDTIASLIWTGAEDTAELAAELRVDGKTAYLALRSVCYDGRWFNLDYSSYSLTRTARESWQQYLLFPTEEEQAEISRLLEEEYTEENAKWDAMQKSGLTGCEWPLVSLEAPGIKLCKTASEAESDSGSAIHGTLRLYRTGGGMVTLTASPALQEDLCMADAAARILFSWSPDGIPVFYTNKNGKQIPIFRAYDKQDIYINGMDQMTVEMKDSAITFTLDNGIKAVFRKPDTHAPEAVQGASAAPAVTRLEGNGYRTPEEAVLAYVEAMNRSDARGMLSTFAMESYIDHGNPMAHMEQLRLFNAKTSPFGTPYINDDIRSLAAMARYGSIARDLLFCCASYSISNAEEPAQLKTAEEIEAFLEPFGQSPLRNLTGNVEFVEWMDPVRMSNGYMADYDTSELKKYNLAVCGGEALTELVAHLKINGRDVYQDMMCVRYAGRWYNLDAGAMVTNSFNVYPTRANLWIPDEKELEEISRRMAAE